MWLPPALTLATCRSGGVGGRHGFREENTKFAEVRVGMWGGRVRGGGVYQQRAGGGINGFRGENAKCAGGGGTNAVLLFSRIVPFTLRLAIY